MKAFTKNETMEFERRELLGRIDAVSGAIDLIIELSGNLEQAAPIAKNATGFTFDPVEQAEQVLFGMGFSDFRARIREDGTLLQFPESQLPRARDLWPEIVQAMQQFFDKDAIRLDPKGR